MQNTSYGAVFCVQEAKAPLKSLSVCSRAESGGRAGGACSAGAARSAPPQWEHVAFWKQRKLGSRERSGELERWRRERRSRVERSGEKRRGKRMEKVKGSWKVEGGRRRRRRWEKRKVRVVGGVPSTISPQEFPWKAEFRDGLLRPAEQGSRAGTRGDTRRRQRRRGGPGGAERQQVEQRSS